jgi:hypothetical protein
MAEHRTKSTHAVKRNAQAPGVTLLQETESTQRQNMPGRRQKLVEIEPGGIGDRKMGSDRREAAGKTKIRNAPGAGIGDRPLFARAGESGRNTGNWDHGPKTVHTRNEA